MPLRKKDDSKDRDGSAEAATVGRKFPPEAYSYDTDITDEVVKRVQREADKVLDRDEWVVIDGVEKQ